MSYTLLDEDSNLSYDELEGKLKEGETLVATWRVDLSNLPKARLVTDEDGYNSITSKAKVGLYNDVRWFASTTGSTNYFDYV
jgi:hypothetical protein